MLGRGGSGLEVGSYVGAFLAAAREEGLQFEGLDVNAQVNAFSRAMGFTVHDGDVSAFHADRTFDVVAIWNTFDQLADPRATVNAAATLLRPRGTASSTRPFTAGLRTAIGSSARPRVLCSRRTTSSRFRIATGSLSAR
jgi:2-polyprenyl-3-methyl-5-hydroxy-6-metoxy-1,4-benzoquinol methylase